MKRLAFCLIMLSIFAVSCGKDKTDEIDITEWKWKLISVTANNEMFKPKEKKSRYILEFVNDSIFHLNLSVNSGGGKYQILSKGEVTINFGSFTEICCENNFDNKLIEAFNEVTTYEVIGNKLTFKGSEGEVEFKKKW